MRDEDQPTNNNIRQRQYPPILISCNINVWEYLYLAISISGDIGTIDLSNSNVNTALDFKSSDGSLFTDDHLTQSIECGIYCNRVGMVGGGGQVGGRGTKVTSWLDVGISLHPL